MSREQIVAIFGEPKFRLHGAYLNYPSMGLQLALTGREPDKLGRIIANPYDAASLTRHDFPGQTDKGICIGSTKEEVVDTYGEPDPRLPEDRTTNYPLRYKRLGLMFAVGDGKVLQFIAGRTD